MKLGGGTGQGLPMGLHPQGRLAHGRMHVGIGHGAIYAFDFVLDCHFLSVAISCQVLARLCQHCNSPID